MCGLYGQPSLSSVSGPVTYYLRIWSIRPPKRYDWALALKMWSANEQHWHWLGACYKCRVSTPTQDLLNKNVRFNNIPSDSCVHQSWEALLEMMMLKIFWKLYVKGSGKVQLMIHKNHTVLMVLITEVKSLKVLGLLDNVMFPIRFHLLRNRTPSSPPVGFYCQLYLSAFLFLFLPSEVASHSLGFLTSPQSIIWVTVLIRVIWTLKYFKNSYIFLHFFFQF